MPSWNEILLETRKSPSFDDVRHNYIDALSKKTGRNIIIYYSGWMQKQGAPVDFSINSNDKIGFMTAIKDMDKTKGVDLVLHTPGGSIAATESLVKYLKSIFGNNIRAIVPQIAMSAGTMISLACKEILLGKHSCLGPIDPQVNIQNSSYPAHGFIEEFERAKKEILDDNRMINIWQFILSKYNPTFIGECEKAIKWANTIVQQWLIENMFSEEKEKEKLAKNIVQELGDHSLTLSHSREISLEDLKKLKLKILEIEKDKNLQDLILSVHYACIITLADSSAYKIIQNQNNKAIIQQIQMIQS